MKNLNNSEILIGRETGNGRLMLSLEKNGRNKTATLGTAGSVPSCISRCRPGEGIAHCKISIDAEGNITIVNMKAQNTTYVNDSEIASKRITSNSQISLGKDRYPIDLNAILNVANDLVKQFNTSSQPATNKEKEYSIKPLKAVWDTYHDDMFALQKKQKNQGLFRTLYLPCVILSGIAGTVATNIGLDKTTADIASKVIYSIGVVILFYGIISSFKDNSLEEKERITERFQDNYVCPNPECGHFMGNQPYNVLRKNTVCPYCKCKLNEN